jgi:hypothetical protein
MRRATPSHRSPTSSRSLRPTMIEPPSCQVTRTCRITSAQSSERRCRVSHSDRCRGRPTREQVAIRMERESSTPQPPDRGDS